MAKAPKGLGGMAHPQRTACPRHGGLDARQGSGRPWRRDAGSTGAAAGRILQAAGPVCRADCAPLAARAPDAGGRKRPRRPFLASGSAGTCRRPSCRQPFSTRAGIGGADPALAASRPCQPRSGHCMRGRPCRSACRRPRGLFTRQGAAGVQCRLRSCMDRRRRMRRRRGWGYQAARGALRRCIPHSGAGASACRHYSDHTYPPPAALRSCP